jgi:hypothetical protein
MVGKRETIHINLVGSGSKVAPGATSLKSGKSGGSSEDLYLGRKSKTAARGKPLPTRRP